MVSGIMPWKSVRRDCPDLSQGASFDLPSHKSNEKSGLSMAGQAVLSDAQSPQAEIFLGSIFLKKLYLFIYKFAAGERSLMRIREHKVRLLSI